MYSITKENASFEWRRKKNGKPNNEYTENTMSLTKDWKLKVIYAEISDSIKADPFHILHMCKAKAFNDIEKLANNKTK